MNDETRYRILKILHQNPDVSQRDLAKALDISVGKVNYCLKALIEMGWIKAKNFKNSENKKGYVYFLTHQGIKEKARVTWRFLKIKQAEYQILMEELEELRSEVAAFNITEEGE